MEFRTWTYSCLRRFSTVTRPLPLQRGMPTLRRSRSFFLLRTPSDFSTGGGTGRPSEDFPSLAPLCTILLLGSVFHLPPGSCTITSGTPVSFKMFYSASSSQLYFFLTTLLPRFLRDLQVRDACPSSVFRHFGVFFILSFLLFSTTKSLHRLSSPLMNCFAPCRSSPCLLRCETLVPLLVG